MTQYLPPTKTPPPRKILQNPPPQNPPPPRAADRGHPWIRINLLWPLSLSLSLYLPSHYPDSGIPFLRATHKILASFRRISTFSAERLVYRIIVESVGWAYSVLFFFYCSVILCCNQSVSPLLLCFSNNWYALQVW